MRAHRATRRAASAALFIACGLLTAGCASHAPKPHGDVPGAQFEGQEFFQSEGNRIVGHAMQANLQSLMLLADKLYRRNPVQWRKTAASREAALLAIRQAVMQEADEAAGQEPPEQESASAIAWPALQGRRDVAALALALSPDFTGDRVAARPRARAVLSAGSKPRPLFLILLFLIVHICAIERLGKTFRKDLV